MPSSDLKQFTDLQAARIQHLESLLGYPSQQPWQSEPTPYDGFSHDQEAESGLPSLAELEVMRPSPEPESRAFGEAFYDPFSQHAAISAFKPSPAALSSGTGTHNEVRRSASLSGSASLAGSGSPMEEEIRGRQMARPERMDLDTMFEGLRREDDGGMRW